jgi:(R,R)-butanediol dehydrogenase / meso-butanediol dehydrogenase / diacetyl reductase
VRAAVFRAPGDVRIESVPEPPAPGPGELLIRVSKAALCGTDSAEWHHGPLLARPPVVLGHEFTGEVAAVGPIVAGSHAGEPVTGGFAPGTRVVSGAGISCGRCDWCAIGRTNLCASYETLGLHRDGGLAEYVLSPASICREVPAGLDDVGAAMAQPLAVALHAARRGRVTAGRSCVVIGAGGIGAFIVAAAAALGADPLIAVDVAEGRLRTAEKLGATRTVLASTGSASTGSASTVLASTGSAGPGTADHGDLVQAVKAAVGQDGAHVVIEASGAPASPAAALELVRRGGDVVIVGLQAHPFGIDLFSVATREVDVHGTLAHVCGEDLAAAVSVLAGTDLARTVLGDVIPLGDLVEGGLRPLAERKAHGKIVVDVPGSS